MLETTYSVYFTGHWLSEPASGSRMELLRRLFPHAGDDRLEHFLDRRRVLLIHGEPLEMAKHVVMSLHEHGLQCEIAEDAAVPPDIQAAPVMARPRPAPAAAAPLSALRTPPAHEAEFTPRGQKILRALMVVAGILVIAASWSAWRRLNHGPSAALDIPSGCATDTETTWYGGIREHVLACVARTASGARYRLTLRCDHERATRATLAFFDPVGAPRAPAWEGGTATQRSIRYSGGDAAWQRTVLRRGDAVHVGTLEGIDASSFARLLAAPFLDLADVFADEAVRFDLEAARWYIDYFTGTCGLSRPAG